jgi:hypothetical protein
MMTLNDYFRQQGATEFFVRIVHREDGKPVKASISPSGIVGDPFEFEVDMPSTKGDGHK